MHTSGSSARAAVSLLLAAALVVALQGCPGGSTSGAPAFDLGQQRDWQTPRQDFTPARDTAPGCDFADGQSCAGGAACPDGLAPIIEQPDGKCRCRPPCDPQAANQCRTPVCERVCVPLTDSSGTPIAGQGRCLPDPGQAEGEPCAPGSCKQALDCIGPDNAHAFCRRRCDQPGDCRGFKMVCGEITGQPDKVCVPGESPGGPGVGESCQGVDVFCETGLICDPADSTCLQVCNDDDGKDPCAAPSTCMPLVDTALALIVGSGCK